MHFEQGLAKKKLGSAENNHNPESSCFQWKRFKLVRFQEPEIHCNTPLTLEKEGLKYCRLISIATTTLAILLGQINCFCIPNIYITSSSRKWTNLFFRKSGS